MPIWTAVGDADMQRQRDNAYMYRRSASKEPWAMMATQVGNPGPETGPDFMFECFATDPMGKQFVCQNITRMEFDALTQDMVGIDADDGLTDPPPVDPDADKQWVINDPVTNEYYINGDPASWTSDIAMATVYSNDEKLEEELPTAERPDATWQEHITEESMRRNQERRRNQGRGQDQDQDQNQGRNQGQGMIGMGNQPWENISRGPSPADDINNPRSGGRDPDENQLNPRETGPAEFTENRDTKETKPRRR